MVDEILIDMKWRAIYSSQSANTGSCIIKFAQKHSKYLFNYFKKQSNHISRKVLQIAVIFLAQHRNHKFNFAQSSFPIYPRQKTVSVNIPHSIGIMLQIFYRILLLNNLKILVSVMLLNHHIVLFTCFD